jgi:hypothetical protein
MPMVLPLMSLQRMRQQAKLFRLLPLPSPNVGAIRHQIAAQSQDQHQHMFRH